MRPLAGVLADLLDGAGGASLCAELAAEGPGGLARALDRGELPEPAARRLAAAVELAGHLVEPGPARLVLSDPGSTARYLMPRWAYGAVETFGAVALDARHQVLAVEGLSVGCLTASLVHPREVFAFALRHRAASLVLFHNHPSGDPEPSAEDLALTRRLAAAGSLMGIEILDHLVLGAGRYVSLKTRGVL